jgi:hypothetical protein
MHTAGVRRLVAVTGVGTGESRGHGRASRTSSAGWG